MHYVLDDDDDFYPQEAIPYGDHILHVQRLGEPTQLNEHRRPRRKRKEEE